MRKLLPGLSQHIRENLIVIEQETPINLAPERRGGDFVTYQRWRLATGRSLPPQAALRHYRSLYQPGANGPLAIEIPGRSGGARAYGPAEWDDTTLAIDLLWKGAWDGVPHGDQPGLAIIRPDGGVITSASPAESRPIATALLAYPLLTTHELAAACEQMRLPPPSARDRSTLLGVWERQGLLLPAPDSFAALHAAITRPHAGRTRGRQAIVYFSIPAYALAVSDHLSRRRWDADPEAEIRRAMDGAPREFQRAEELLSRLRKGRLWNERWDNRPASAGASGQVKRIDFLSAKPEA